MKAAIVFSSVKCGAGMTSLCKPISS